MMKKSSVLLAAIAAMISSGLTVHTCADEDNSYALKNMPYIYFKACGGESCYIINDDHVYVDTSSMAGDETALSCDLYVHDDTKRLDHISAVWSESGGTLKLTGRKSPVEKYGHSPFAELDDIDAGMTEDCIYENALNVSYSNIGENAFTLTGESSDEYPAACFEVQIGKDVRSGSYEIACLPAEYRPAVRKIIPHAIAGLYKSPTETEKYYVGDYSPKLTITVSDRALGDTDGNGTVNEDDAVLLLENIALMNNNEEYDTAVTTAGDVNGDSMIDEEDVCLILDYCTANADDMPEVSFVDHVKQQIAEE